MQSQWLDGAGELTREAESIRNHFYRFAAEDRQLKGVGWLEIEGVAPTEDTILRRSMKRISRPEAVLSEFEWQVLFTVFLEDDKAHGYRDDGMYILELNNRRYAQICNGEIELPELLARLERMSDDEEVEFNNKILN